MGQQILKVAIYNRWLRTLGGGERYTCAIAEALSGMADVAILTHNTVAPDLLRDRLGTSLDAVAITLVKDSLGNNALSRRSADYDLFINASNRDLFPARAKRSVLVAFFPLRGVPVIGGRRAARATKRAAQMVLRRLQSRSHVVEMERRQLAAVHSTYGQVWAISRFVQRWVAEYWGRESQLVYPPVDVTDAPPDITAKRNIILSVGRFFPDRHNKKHIAMIRAFAALCQCGLTGWELHLAGGTEEQPAYRAYVDAVKRAGDGYPVHLHLNIPLDELRDLYLRSKLFWHATGFDEDEERYPERCEHFGISTVEAMAAGCVPIVVGKGGQPEIVTHGADGFLWHDLDELGTQTMTLVRDESTRVRLAINAIGSAERFRMGSFKRTVVDIVRAYVEANQVSDGRPARL